MHRSILSKRAVAKMIVSLSEFAQGKHKSKGTNSLITAGPCWSCDFGCLVGLHCSPLQEKQLVGDRREGTEQTHSTAIPECACIQWSPYLTWYFTGRVCVLKRNEKSAVSSLCLLHNSGYCCC